MRLFLISLFLFISCTGCGQDSALRHVPETDTLNISLGDSAITVYRFRYNQQSAPFFVHLHHDEQTADSILHNYLGRSGGTALSIANQRQRLVSFPYAGKRYRFDPNRMFTQEGIRQSLGLLSQYDTGAARTIYRFSQQLLALLPDSTGIIAMHNNTEGRYALHSYAAEGPYATETKALHSNPRQDPDDFVLTTDPVLFTHLQNQGINVVLQNNEAIADDGSLGYYFGKNNRPYVNIEAEHGHSRAQQDLLHAVLNIRRTTADVEARAVVPSTE